MATMNGFRYASSGAAPLGNGSAANGLYLPMAQVRSATPNGSSTVDGMGARAGNPSAYTASLSFEGRSPISDLGLPTEETQAKLQARASRNSDARSGTGTGTGTDSDDFDARKTALQRFVTSGVFQNSTIIMIVANTVAMAFEADYPSWEGWQVVDGIFLFYFTVELTLRLCAFGCAFFTSAVGSEEQGWNIFDFTIVFLGIMDTCVVSQLMANRKHKVGRWFMMLRILRIARALKLFKSFPELYRLGRGLIESTQYVFYIFILLGLLMLVGAIFCVNLVGKQAETFDDPEMIREWFGSVPAAMETLFIFLTLDDWSTPARMVSKELGWMNCFWILFIMLGPFTLLSLLTGLMADKMEEARVEADDKKEEASLEETRKLLESLRQVFTAITPKSSSVTQGFFPRETSDVHAKLANGEGEEDTVDDGAEVSRAMFLHHAQHICDELAKTEVVLDPAEMPEIFDCFDKDGSGSLSWEEFRDGVVQINDFGATKAMVMWLEGEIVKLDNHMSSGDATWDKKLAGLHKRAAGMQKSVSKLEKKLGQFFQSVGYDPDAEESVE